MVLISVTPESGITVIELGGICKIKKHCVLYAFSNFSRECPEVNVCRCTGELVRLSKYTVDSVGVQRAVNSVHDDLYHERLIIICDII